MSTETQLLVKSYTIELSLPARDYQLTVSYLLDGDQIPRAIILAEYGNSPQGLINLLKDLGISHDPL